MPDPIFILLALPMSVLLAAFLWMFGATAGFDIGCGHGEQVDVVSPTSTYPDMGFSPTVSILLEELVEYYGDPDYVWFISASPAEDATTGVLLDWNSINMFVELPQVANKTYAVHKRTGIEMIIFSSMAKMLLLKTLLLWK